MVSYYVTAFLGALVISLGLTPLTGKIARRLGFVDKPDGHRKVHSAAIPLGGGLAVLFALAATSAAVIGVGLAWRVIPLDEHLIFAMSLLLACTLLAVVGVIDDSVGIRGRYKLAGQIAACLVLIACGLKVQILTVCHLEIELGWFAIPFMIFWLIGTINAINLLDGVDGLASSIGVLLSLTTALLAWQSNHMVNSFIALALAGALIGFLRYNFAPASIYLGDTGSMLIGLVLGAITLQSHTIGSTSVTLFVPVCILAIPIFDSVAALVRRKLTGRSLFATDRGHFHHLLLHRGWTSRQTTLFISSVCLVTCLGAVLSIYYRKDIVAILTMVFVLSALTAGKFFGHVEFGLLIHRLGAALRRYLKKRTPLSNCAHERIYRVNGSSKWDPLWTALIEATEKYGLIQLELTISIPSRNDLFHAAWAKPATVASDQFWRIKLPLLVDGHKVGKILISGYSTESSILQINQFADFLEPIEDQLKYCINCVAHCEQVSGRHLWSDHRCEMLKDEQECASCSCRPSDPHLEQLQQFSVN